MARRQARPAVSSPQGPGGSRSPRMSSDLCTLLTLVGLVLGDLAGWHLARPLRAEWLVHAGHADVAKGWLDRARRRLEAGKVLAEGRGDGGRLQVAAALQGLGHVCAKRGEFAEAERLFRQCLDLRRAALPGDHKYLAGSLYLLAAVVRVRGDLDGAAAM